MGRCELRNSLSTGFFLLSAGIHHPALYGSKKATMGGSPIHVGGSKPSFWISKTRLVTIWGCRVVSVAAGIERLAVGVEHTGRFR